MANIVYSNPVDVISFKIFGIFDAFRNNSKLNRLEDSVQIVLLLVSLYKCGVISEDNFTNDFSISDLKTLILESQLNQETQETFLLIIDELSDSLSKVFRQPIDYLSFHLFQIEKELLTENFPSIIDDVLYRIFQSQERYTGQFIQPAQLTSLICNLVELPKGSKIYNPFAGVASFGAYFDQTQHYFGQEINKVSWALGALRLLAHGKSSNLKYACEDSIENWPSPSNKFNLIVTFPPFGLRVGQQINSLGQSFKAIEPFLIEKSIQSLEPNGTAIFIMPRGFFSSSSKANFYTRKYLVDNGFVKAIVDLPSNLLDNTGVSISLLVLEKNQVNQNKGILFIDASKEFTWKNRKNVLGEDNITRIINTYKSFESIPYFSRIIDQSEILNNDYNLDGRRYISESILDINNGKIVKLKELIAPISQTKKYDDNAKYPLVNPSVLNDNIKFSIEDLPLHYNKMGYTLLNRSALLISSIGGIFRFSYFNFEGKPILCSPSVLAFSIDENKISLNYLAKQLTEEYFTYQAKARVKGTTINRISKNDILDLRVSIVSIDQQKKIDDEILRFFHQKDKNLDLLEEQEKKVFEQNAFLRHSLATPIANVFTFYGKMMQIIESNPQLKVEDLGYQKMKPTDRYNFADMKNILERDLHQIKSIVSTQISAITMVQEAVLEPVNFDAFLREYFDSIATTKSEIKFIFYSFTDDLMDGIAVENFVTVNANIDLIRIMLDNFVENAEKHGFYNDEDKRIEIDLIYDEDEEQFVIEIANSGKPFPKDFPFDDFIKKERKSGANAGSGYGGWLIYEIIRKFGGSLEIADNSVFKPHIHQGLVTSFIIKFPLVTGEYE